MTATGLGYPVLPTDTTAHTQNAGWGSRWMGPRTFLKTAHHRGISEGRFGNNKVFLRAELQLNSESRGAQLDLLNLHHEQLCAGWNTPIWHSSSQLSFQVVLFKLHPEHWLQAACNSVFSSCKAQPWGNKRREGTNANKRNTSNFSPLFPRSKCESVKTQKPLYGHGALGPAAQRLHDPCG